MRVDQDFVLIITSCGIGEGEPDLGAKLTDGFFKSLVESQPYPGRIIFMNSGIFLTTEGSPVTDRLRQMEEQGTEIKSCATCLAYYGRRDRLLIGSAGDMRDTVDSLVRRKKVVIL